METQKEKEETNESNKNTIDSVIVDKIIEKIEKIREKNKDKTGEETLNDRMDQVAYAKILTNTYNKDIKYLIEAYTELGICYLDNGYYDQANEHLINALKLNENKSSDDNLSMKEYQIKISVNLARSYLQNGKYDEAKKLCEKILYINKILFGDYHPSNADIYYILSKVNSQNENYTEAIDNLRCMFEIYEKTYGFNSDRTAKICMELGRIYENWNKINESIEYYLNSYKIWENIINDDNYEILFEIAMKISELYSKIKRGYESYDIIAQTEEKYSDKIERSLKDKVNYQKYRIELCANLKDMDLYLKENLKLEEILNNENENKKTLAKTCVTIAYIYLENNDKNKGLEYLKKAKKIFSIYGDAKYSDELNKRIKELENEKENENEKEKEKSDKSLIEY